MTWLEYHELTKHSVESLWRTQHYLDWANMPNPFRHYEGVPVLDLPADPPAPQISALEVLEGKTGNTLARDGAEFLSQLMFYSASICASILLPAISIRPNFTSARNDWSAGPMASIITVPHLIWQNNAPSESLHGSLSTSLPRSFSF